MAADSLSVVLKLSCSVRSFVALAFLLFGTGFGLSSVVQADSPHPFAKLESSVQRIKLSNGLRVVIYRRGDAPVFTGETWVKVGGVDEHAGATGISHMLEHMAFKGSTTIGTRDYQQEEPLLAELESIMQADKRGEEINRTRVEELYKKLDALWVDNEFSNIYQSRGAENLNAATSKDYTMYTVSLPSTAFELWCWMESERLLHPVFRQFYREREVVMEERRMRTDDDPDGRLYELLLGTSYLSHPNRFPVIGYAEDLRSLTATQLEELFHSYYVPENMVLALVGDVPTKGLEENLERYFARLPVGKKVPQVDEVEPVQSAERTAVVKYDATPSFYLAYHKPVYPDPDDATFAILHAVLSQGRSALFAKELVQEKRLASAINTGEAPGDRYPSLFLISATPNAGVSVERLRDEVQGILDRLKEQPISEAELQAAQRKVQVMLLEGMDSNNDLASALARSELFWGDWRVMFGMYERIAKTTAKDVQEVARRYLTVQNRTFVKLERSPQENVK